MRIGVLTSGGDCPGLNAVIRSVVHRAVADHGDEVIGFRDGWKGLLECDYLKLDLDAVGGILARGGTILGSPGCAPSICGTAWSGPRAMSRNSASTRSSRSAARAR
jgi:6-phosphofructokinase 1